MTELLGVHGLCKSYGALRALDGVSFSVHAGELVALLGPNGAGKTTALDLILGLKSADAGVFRFWGQERERITREDKQRIGVHLQNTVFFPELTVREVLHLFRSFYKTGIAAEEAAELFSVGDFLQKRIKHLSGGQRQRVSLACAVVNDPDLVFLDEPTVGVDVQNRQALWGVLQSLKKRGKGIILTTHYLEEAESLSDRIVLLDHGRVVAEGSPR